MQQLEKKCFQFLSQASSNMKSGSNQVRAEYFTQQLKLVLSQDTVKSFAENLKDQIKSRLLLPAIGTRYILSFYINLLEFLREIDPSGSAVESVTKVIKEYVRTRKGSIEVVINKIVSDQRLYEQLGQQQIRNQLSEDGYFSSDSDEQEAANWQPKITVKNLRPQTRIVDTISTLVNIYGSQEAFINAWKAML